MVLLFAAHMTQSISTAMGLEVGSCYGCWAITLVLQAGLP